jgi:hypothetical protein
VLPRLALEVPRGATEEQLAALRRLTGLRSAAFTGASGCPLEGRLLQTLLPALTALTALHLRNVRDASFCQVRCQVRVLHCNDGVKDVYKQDMLVLWEC